MQNSRGYLLDLPLVSTYLYSEKNMPSLKSYILNKIYFSENKLLLRLYSYYAFRIKSSEQTDAFMNENSKILFVHNPKVAGNTLKNVLNLNPTISWHYPPTFLIPPKIWEKYYTIVAVRHPIDRLISSYHYHTQDSYQNYYLQKYPFLHQLDLQEYFNIFKKEPQAILPQVNYIKHHLSDKPVDFIIRYENLLEDVKKLCEKLNLPFETLPHLNSTKRSQKKDYFQNQESFKAEVIDFYQQDFEVFGYEL